MNIKDTIRLNSFKKEEILIEENSKIKEIDYLSRAMSSIANFIREANYIKTDLDNSFYNEDSNKFNQAMIASTKKLTKEEYDMLFTKIKDFYFHKIDFIKDSFDEIFKQKEKKEEENQEQKEEPVASAIIYKEF